MIDIRKNKMGSILFLTFVLVSLYGIIFYEKHSLQLLINGYHHPFFDFFFKYITYLGDGVLFGVAIIIFFFVDKKEMLKYIFTGILVLLVSSVLKRLIFSNSPRPVEVFGSDNLHLIAGVKMAHWHSFPSGHTMVAFAIAAILMMKTKNKILQSTIVFLAIMVGFSRIYLSQHFLVDVFVGSLIGILIALLGIKIVTKLNRP